VILPKSFGLLDDVATTILANPQIGRVEVGGHTDSQGSDAANLDLSQRRAESVVLYLVQHGVDAGRLIPKGYGETLPIATNKTKQGMAENRRVEFQLVDRQPPAAP
jgi:outer membrane protein OmpA-like peptidoglycan-associated protein